MEFTELAATRRSVHEYADRELDRSTIESIFEDVRLTPSSYNLQPWEFLLIREDDRKELLEAHAYGQAHVSEADTVAILLATLDPGAHARRVVDDQYERGDLDADARDRKLDRLRAKRDDPELDRRLWATENVALAAMSLMYAAWDRGVASCPMGGFDAAGVADAFDVPAGYEPRLLVTLGYPAAAATDLEKPRKFRRPVDEFVHFGSFDPRTDRRDDDLPPADG